MNVSRAWLESFLRRNMDSHDLTERMAMLGAPVESIAAVHGDLAPLVVGLVEEVRPHPNADRLTVCSVNDGQETRLQVVCGAPNVVAGKRYPFARVGTEIPGGLTIEKRKIRGEVSVGMLCSARELGLGDDHTGILELVTDADPGTGLLEVLPIADERLEIDVTPNRSDLLSHKGVARELATSYGVQFRLPALPGAGEVETRPLQRADGAAGTSGGVRVAIEDGEGCPRFLGAVIRGLVVGPSPDWLQQRLEAVGVRAINNVVDATNYILFELGQPMHAYDLDTLRGPAVIARRGKAGEAVTTLDGKVRTVDESMTVIADEGGAIGVGGVMGGHTTEVGEGTVNIFLECASFQPSRIRSTRRTLGLSTDASYRFERGVDRWAAPDALRRCIEIVLTTAGGSLDDDPVDVWPEPSYPPRIFLRPSRATQVLGEELSWSDIENHLVAIGATVVSKPDDERIAVDVPGWRPDLREEIDLIEELARIHGYDRFPADLRPFRIGVVPDAPIEQLIAKVRAGLAAEGLYEVLTMPMRPADGEESVAVLNPLSTEDAHLRSRLLPGLILEVEGNWSKGTRDVRLFEVGTVFRRGPAGQPPVEEVHVAAVLTGLRAPRHWSDGGRGADVDRWDVKSVFERAVALAHPGATVQLARGTWVAQTADGTAVGAVEPIEADAPPWAAPVLGFEVVLEPSPPESARFRGLPDRPAASRDVALVLPAGVMAGAVSSVLEGVKGTSLESIEIMSEFRGGDLDPDARSVAYRLTFRAPGRTLRDQEVDKAVRRLLEAVRRETGAQPRAAN